MALMIGRAWVKVAPDTDGFRRETIKQLKKELAGLEKDLASEKGRITVPTEIAVDQKKSAQNLKSFLTKISGQRIVVEVDFDLGNKLDGLASQIESAVADASRKIDTTVDVDPKVDTSAMEREVDQAADRIESELSEAFEGALDGDRVAEWSKRFDKELRKASDSVKEALDGITDLGSANAINSVGQQLLSNAKQMEQSLRNEEMARRRLGKLMNAKKQDADAILAAERKVLEAVEAREAAERAVELVHDRLAKARIDALERQKKAESDAATARMRAFEAEFNQVMADTEKLSDAATNAADSLSRSLEDAGNQAFWAQAQIHDMFEADSEWMGEAQRQADWIRDRDRMFENFGKAMSHNLREAARGARALGDSLRKVRADDLELDFDLSTFEGNLQWVRHSLQELKDDFDDTDLEFHPVLDETSYRAAWARLKWLTRDRFAMIHPAVNKGAAALAERTLKAITLNATGLRNAGRALKNFFEYLERLDKNAPVLATIATGIAAIGGAAVAAVGSVSHLAVELVRMSGAGLALPGLLGGFAIGIGVFVTAIKNLNKEVPKIQEDLDAMSASINQKFWQNARVPLLDAWNKVLPSLERGFDKTASALGRWTAAMAEGFADNLRPESMNYMFDNLAKSIDIAALSADDLGRIMEILGKRGSEYLPRLAAWTNDLAAGFRNWLDEADRTGRLNEIIETGITKLKEFGVLVRESGELIYILGSAAERAGFSGLKEMSEGLTQVNDDLRANQDALDDYFAGSANMADGFKSLIGSIVSGLGEFSGTFETISTDVQSVFEDIGGAFETILGDTDFQQGVEDLFGGVRSAVEDLSDVAPELSDVLGEIGSTAGSVVENIGELGAQVVEAFGPEVTQILEDIQPAIDDLSDSLSGFLDTLSGQSGESDGDLIQALSNLISVASPGLIRTAAANIDTLTESLEDFKAVFEGDWGSIDFNLGEIWNNVMRFINPVPFLVGQLAGSSIATAIWNWVNEQIAEIGNAIETLGRWVSTAMGWLVEQFEAAWNGFWEWLSGLFSGDGGEGSGGSGGSSSQFSLTDAVSDRLGLDDLSFDSVFEEAKRVLQEAWDGFMGWIGDLFGGGGESAGGGSTFNLDFVLNAIDNASTIVSNVGQTIRTWASEKYEAILTAANRTATAISNAKTAIVNWARAKYEALLTAANRTATGISNARTAITTWARRKYEAALTALNNTGRGISAAVSAIRSRVVNATFKAKVTMSNIVSGLGGVVSKIRNAVSNFTARVSTHFANANGNVYPSVKAFANGGFENHVAQIARPSSIVRVWAEPETGGEAYIPLAPAKRERSTAILADVADRFGYKLQRFANGNEPSGNTYGGNNYTVNVQTLRPDVASEVTGDVMFHLKHLAYGGGVRGGI